MIPRQDDTKRLYKTKQVFTFSPRKERKNHFMLAPL